MGVGSPVVEITVVLGTTSTTVPAAPMVRRQETLVVPLSGPTPEPLSTPSDPLLLVTNLNISWIS